MKWFINSAAQRYTFGIIIGIDINTGIGNLSDFEFIAFCLIVFLSALDMSAVWLDYKRENKKWVRKKFAKEKKKASFNPTRRIVMKMIRT